MMKNYRNHTHTNEKCKVKQKPAESMQKTAAEGERADRGRVFVLDELPGVL